MCVVLCFCWCSCDVFSYLVRGGYEWCSGECFCFLLSLLFNFLLFVDIFSYLWQRRIWVVQWRMLSWIEDQRESPSTLHLSQISTEAQFQYFEDFNLIKYIKHQGGRSFNILNTLISSNTSRMCSFNTTSISFLDSISAPIVIADLSCFPLSILQSFTIIANT